MATELPYNKAQEIFEELTGLSMSDHAMHDIVGDLCEARAHTTRRGEGER